ncbi:MAG: hypothetical protein RR284_03480 [Ruthenibacterium sp.]
MDPIAKNVEKQVIVRFFQPDMQLLKTTAKHLAATMPDAKLGLYGQAGEVLVVITAHAYAPAAATELTESAAEQFEQAAGAAAYGRGKGSLAYVTAGEMIESETVVAAADEATGALLETEFAATKRGTKVFDFGADSYTNPKISAKIDAAATFDPDDEETPLQNAADRAAAAAKCTRSDFGAAISGLEGGTEVYAAVAYKGTVYISQIPAGKDAGKQAALSVLDIIRRLLSKEDLPNSKSFRAGNEIDWNMPQKAKTAHKNLVPIVILIVLLLALCGACWYLASHFFFGKDKGDAVPASTSASVTQSVPAQSDAAVTPPPEGAPVSTPASAPAPAPAESAPATQGTTAPVNEGGVVHPFA